jgi:hypothetical protein
MNGIAFTPTPLHSCMAPCLITGSLFRFCVQMEKCTGVTAISVSDIYWMLLSLHTASQRSANVLIIQNFGHPRFIGSFSCQPEGKISNHPMLRIRQARRGMGKRGVTERSYMLWSKTTPRPPTHSYSLTKWSWRCLQVTLDVSLSYSCLKPLTGRWQFLRSEIEPCGTTERMCFNRKQVCPPEQPTDTLGRWTVQLSHMQYK